jgi:hypothetical protein
MKLHHLIGQHLLNGEHLSMTEETINIVIKFDPVAMQVQLQLADVEQARAVETMAMRRIAKNPYTDPLRAADAERDNTLRGLVSIVKGDLRHPDPMVRKAAEELMAIPQLNAAVADRGYEEEEALLNLLISHLTGDYALQVTTAGLNDWVANLTMQNAEVARLHGLAYAAAAAAEGVSVKDARAATDKALGALTKRLDALIEMDTVGAFDAFIAEYNVMIKYYETLIRERQTRNRHKQRNLSAADISSIADQLYSGDRLSPRVQVFYRGVALVEDRDFTVEYTHNIDPGTASVVIRGKGSYTGKKLTTFNIVRTL